MFTPANATSWVLTLDLIFEFLLSQFYFVLYNYIIAFPILLNDFEIFIDILKFLPLLFSIFYIQSHF